MFIQKEIVYTINGKSFPSLAKVEDYLQNEILTRLRTDLLTRDMHLKYSSVVGLTEYLIENRHEFAQLLGYELPDESEDD